MCTNKTVCVICKQSIFHEDMKEHVEQIHHMTLLAYESFYSREISEAIKNNGRVVLTDSKKDYLNIGDII